MNLRMHRFTKRVVWNKGGIAFFGKIASLIVGFGINITLARTLPPSDLGPYVLTLSVVNTMAMFGQLGLNVWVVKSIPEQLVSGAPDNARSQLFNVLLVGMVSSIFIGLLYVLSLGRYFGLKHGYPEMLDLWPWMLAFIILVTLQKLIAEGFRAYKWIGTAILCNDVLMQLLLIVLLLAAYSGQASVNYRLAMGYTVFSTFLVVVMSASILVRKKMIKINLFPTQVIVSLIKQSFPMFILLASSMVTTEMDFWFLGVTQSPEQVAIYGVATKFARLVMFPLVVINALVLPYISEFLSLGHRKNLETFLQSVAFIGTGLSLIMYFFLLLFGKQVLAKLWGVYYVSSAPLLLWLGAGQLINVSTGAGQAVLLMANKTKELLYFLTGAFVLKVGLFVLANVFGVVNSEIVAVISSVVLALLNLGVAIEVQKKVKISVFPVWKASSMQILQEVL